MSGWAALALRPAARDPPRRLRAISAWPRPPRRRAATSTSSASRRRCAGHVGDGNFHLCIVVDAGDGREMARATSSTARLVTRAIEMGAPAPASTARPRQLDALSSNAAHRCVRWGAETRARPAQPHEPGKVLRLERHAPSRDAGRQGRLRWVSFLTSRSGGPRCGAGGCLREMPCSAPGCRRGRSRDRWRLKRLGIPGSEARSCYSAGQDDKMPRGADSGGQATKSPGDRPWQTSCASARRRRLPPHAFDHACTRRPRHRAGDAPPRLGLSAAPCWRG